MINIECGINSPVVLHLYSANDIVTVAADITVIDDTGIVINPDITLDPVTGASGLFKVTIKFNSTGTKSIMTTPSNTIHARINVVSRTIYTMLKNIEDESIGSWQWDKQAGKLVMLRQDGTTLANFDVTETMTVASRERTS